MGAAPAAAPDIVADVRLRIEIQRLARHLAARGDDLVAAILASAIYTIDRRIADAETAPAASKDERSMELVCKRVTIYGRPVPVTLERAFWEMVDQAVGPEPQRGAFFERAFERKGRGSLASAVRVMILGQIKS